MFIDNKKKGKVGQVLKQHLEPNSKLSIISSYFTIYGFKELSQELKKIDSINLLLTDANITQDISILYGEIEDTKYKNLLDQKKIAKECYEWLSQKAKIRQLDSKTNFTFSTYNIENKDNNNLAIQGNSNFSTTGLGVTATNSLFMNTAVTDFESTKDLLNNFNEIWNNETIVKDIKEDILKNLENIFKYNSPQFVYFMTLYNIFKDFVEELDEDKIIKAKTGFKDTLVWNKLYNFQKDGVIGAIDKLEKYNGCIIADSVGLGKTFEALAVIKYYELRNDRVLVLCPKKLRENWTLYTVNDKRNVLNKDRFNYDVLNHTDLSRAKGYSGEINLSTLNWSNYDLIVIDESHNFRNTSTNKKTSKSRYAFLLEEVLQKGVKTKVLMLSATPVNNRLNDLKNQLYFVTEGQDESFKDFGIKSIEQTLRKAQNKFNQWLELPNSDRTTNNLLDKLNFDYFKLLDLITIARSRKHITKYYNTKDIGKFPERLKPINYKPDIDTLNQFPALSEINKTIRKLTLCAYSPLKYVLPFKLGEYEEKYDIETHSGSKFKQIDRENSLIHLMRVNLLKRMESSINSFTLTVEKLLKRNEDLLKMIESHNSSEISEMSIVDIDIEDDEYADRLIGNKVKVLISDIDKIKWMQDIQNDILKLQELYNHAKQVTQDRDLKLQTLTNIISNKIQNPINTNNKKIIIFTAFADTAMYLYESISKEFIKHNIHSCLITGSGNNKTTFDTKDKDLNSLLTHFSPVSKEREKIDTQTQGEIDILIATDCISEGQNLQDCDYLVNYDIHWNPVRIIQRFGRVDRLGSKNEKIQLVNFWANMELDEYINLESRVSGRMVLLDVSATGEENVIDVSNQEMNDLSYRAKQLKELQTQVVDLEDVSGNISITDLTLNDFRMDLMNYLKEHKGTLEKTPLGINSIVKNQVEEIKDKKGVIYCLKMLSEQNNNKDSYSLEPYYLVYVDENNEVKLPYSNAKNILDIYKKLTLGNDDIQSELFKSFENETKDYSNMNHYVKGLQNSIESIIGKKDEKGLDSLFSGGGTNITANSFTGSEDFEIVSYLVIK